ncbi:MAG: hypothetical protein D6690_13010 [Nitrospirae bacterium]|nr:MAG: hypothetical protein D6690_13010 [Nitrospirota bacterium]
MSHSPPRHPAYRVTLFYGPDHIEEEPQGIQCVFNVKKRSWKGGVHIAVFIFQSQWLRMKERLKFDRWLQSVVMDVPSILRSQCLSRAQDLLAQQLCYLKLALALDRDLPQEHGQIAGQQFLEELEEQVERSDAWLKQQILNELDVESLYDECSSESDEP